MGEISKGFLIRSPSKALPTPAVIQTASVPSWGGDEAILDGFPCKSRLFTESHGADSADSLASTEHQHKAPP